MSWESINSIADAYYIYVNLGGFLKNQNETGLKDGFIL